MFPAVHAYRSGRLKIPELDMAGVKALAVDPGHRRERIRLRGELPSPTEPLIGCPFASRCPEVQDLCRREPPPPLEAKREGHLAACHFR